MVKARATFCCLALFVLLPGCFVIGIRAETSPRKEPEQKPATKVSADLRLVRVADGAVMAGASHRGQSDALDELARSLVEALVHEYRATGRAESVAVVSLRDRSGTPEGQMVADELADKLTDALLKRSEMSVRERIDLRALLDERDLEAAAIVHSPPVRGRLGGTDCVVLGGVSLR